MRARGAAGACEGHDDLSSAASRRAARISFASARCTPDMLRLALLSAVLPVTSAILHWHPDTVANSTVAASDLIGRVLGADAVAHFELLLLPGLALSRSRLSVSLPLPPSLIL